MGSQKRSLVHHCDCKHNTGANRPGQREPEQVTLFTATRVKVEKVYMKPCKAVIQQWGFVTVLNFLFPLGGFVTRGLFGGLVILPKPCREIWTHSPAGHVWASLILLGQNSRGLKENTAWVIAIEPTSSNYVTVIYVNYSRLPKQCNDKEERY